MKELVTFSFEEDEYHRFVEFARSQGMSLRRLILQIMEEEIPKRAKELEPSPDTQ